MLTLEDLLRSRRLAVPRQEVRAAVLARHDEVVHVGRRERHAEHRDLRMGEVTVGYGSYRLAFIDFYIDRVSIDWRLVLCNATPIGI